MCCVFSGKGAEGYDAHPNSGGRPHWHTGVVFLGSAATVRRLSSVRNREMKRWGGQVRLLRSSPQADLWFRGRAPLRLAIAYAMLL